LDSRTTTAIRPVRSRNKPYLFIALTIVVAGLSACATVSKPVRPMEYYDTAPKLQQLSHINIPLRINLEAMEKSLNQQLKGVIYEDKSTEDGDNLAIKVEKTGNLTFAVAGKDLQFKVPLLLNFKYKAGFTYLTGSAEIALQFRTNFSFRPNWSVNTNTQLESHEWIRKPKLQVGAIQIPIGFIGDIVLNNSKHTLAAAIDKQAQEQLDFREQIADAWKRLFEPVQISTQFKTWLQIHPQFIAMTPLSLNEEEIKATIIVESKPLLSLGARPSNMAPTPLPPFKPTEVVTNNFAIYLHAEVPYQEAELLAREQLRGETFSAGNKSVTLEDIEMYGNGNTLIVSCQLSGNFRGNIYFEGKPFFNMQRNSIDISDLNYSLETQNFLHKTAGWILKSNMKKVIQEKLDFYLAFNLKELEAELQRQLSHYPISKDIYLRGILDALELQNAYLVPNAFKVQVGLKGQVEVHIQGVN